MDVALNTQRTFGNVQELSPGNFKAPENIIQTVHAARTIYMRLREAHLKRIKLYAEILGLIQGNPPYNPADLAAAGLDHISNFNDMSANAQIERACLAYWNLSYNAQTFAFFKLRFRLPKDGDKSNLETDPDSVYYAQLMARHWDYAVKTCWPSFITNIAALSTQLVELGISPCIWPDERDPRWRIVELSKFYVPDQTQSDLELLTTVCIESEFTVQYLWGIYQEFKDKPEAAAPWNVDQIGRLLVLITTNIPMSTLSAADRLELERKILAGDVSMDRYFSNVVRIISLLQKEYTGKISHYMFPKNLGIEEDSTQEGFLFYEHEQFYSMQEATVVFTINPGQFTIHMNRGLGHKIFSLAQAKQMTENRVVDMAGYASTPIIKTSSLATKDVDQIKFYPGVPLNIGNYDLLQNNLGANLQGVVGAAEHLQQLMQYNLTYSGNDPGQPDPDKGSLSPTQTRLQATNEFAIQKNYIQHFYSSLDVVVRNMTIKMFNSKPGYPGYDIAETWKERCLDDGVPEYIFELDKDRDRYKMPKKIDVCATRVAGGGSQVAQLIGLQELGNIVSSFGPRGSRQYQRDYIIATVGAEHIDEYMSDADQSDERSQGATIAGLENAVMQAGKAPIFSPDNDHRAHFAVHMALGSQMQQNLQQQQMDTIEADSVFHVMIPHLQEHFQALQQSEFTKAFAEKYKKPFNDMVRYATFNHRNAVSEQEAKVKQQQQQQQDTQSAMTDEQLKTMQVTNDEHRKDAKLAAQTQRQEKAGTAKEAALVRKTEADIQINTKKAEGEVQAKMIKAGAPGQGGFENTADTEANANPSGYLSKIGGDTVAPYNTVEPYAYDQTTQAPSPTPAKPKLGSPLPR